MINDMIRQNTITFGFPSITKSDGTGSGAAGSSDFKFKNIFDNTLQTKTAESRPRNDQKENHTKTESASADNRKNTGVNKEPVKAEKKDVRECTGKTEKEASSKEAAGKVKEKAEEPVKSKAADNNSKNSDNTAAINILAGILGMQPEELASMLQSAGISADELTAGKMENITAKLSELAGLSAEQKNALSELLNIAAQKLSENTGTGVNGDASANLTAQLTGMEKQDDPVIGNSSVNASIKVVVQGGIQQGDSIKTAIAKLKIKLAEQNSKASQETPAVAQETTAAVENNPGVEIKGIDEKSKSALSSDTGSENMNKEASPIEKETRVSAVEVKASTSSEADNVENSGSNTVNPLNLNQLQKNDISSVLDKTETKVTVQAKEIINQVVEKAKIINTPEKSEIMMELKPDSLGKLSLKVVTEQGIVLAKFVAESEQVKQILETNMQLLKDSLEKQGMNVQGFSVSVRQDNNNYSSGKQYENQPTGSRSAFRPAALNRSSGGVFIRDAAESISRNNYYRFGSSTINVTA